MDRISKENPKKHGRSIVWRMFLIRPVQFELKAFSSWKYGSLFWWEFQKLEGRHRLLGAKETWSIELSGHPNKNPQTKHIALIANETVACVRLPVRLPFNIRMTLRNGARLFTEVWFRQAFENKASIWNLPEPVVVDAASRRTTRSEVLIFFL